MKVLSFRIGLEQVGYLEQRPDKRCWPGVCIACSKTDITSTTSTTISAPVRSQSTFEENNPQAKKQKKEKKTKKTKLIPNRKKFGHKSQTCLEIE